MTVYTLFGLIAAHFVGDYLLQSNWMASEKTRRWWPALVHGAVYTLPFLFVTQNVWALLVIGGTHAVIDRYRLAKYLVFAKEFLSPRSWWPKWSENRNNFGYSPETPAWLAGWLLFIGDNTLHFMINFVAVSLTL